MGSRTVLSREGRRYRASVCAALAVMRVVRMNGRLEVRVTVCPPDNRRRDLDNLLAMTKQGIDAIAEVLKVDDYSFEYTLRRGVVSKGGKVIVRI